MKVTIFLAQPLPGYPCGITDPLQTWRGKNQTKSLFQYTIIDINSFKFCAFSGSCPIFMAFTCGGNPYIVGGDHFSSSSKLFENSSIPG
jgi:hypothetical protein